MATAGIMQTTQYLTFKLDNDVLAVCIARTNIPRSLPAGERRRVLSAPRPAEGSLCRGFPCSTRPAKPIQPGGYRRF
jgi:hypothetical protein